ncbi:MULTISPECIES: hypothetical protein [Anaeromyxobacter]|uniref:hypothetical protein n=1 Tax=Anaeromyxobacter TaxID=161492 RepID=UPI001F59F9A5|nr:MULTISPECIES: hypothetical protein [unclassified Anaeromyxobacter]
MTKRLLAALAVAALALPAAAYVLPVSSILSRLAARRAELSLASVEAQGTFQAEGPDAQKLAQAAGVELRGQQLTVPARFLMKVPGRCRLELAPLDVPEASRPYVAIRDSRVVGSRGLAELPAAVALVRSTCALLGPSLAGGGASAYASVLGRRGVSTAEVSIGRFDGRLAYVVGARSSKDAKPVAYVDKETFQPMRLVSAEGGVMLDVRLLGWGSPTGGDWFPRAVEVWKGEAVQLRFTTEKAAANPRLGDPLFP